jgi:hypothetical protein
MKPLIFSLIAFGDLIFEFHRGIRFKMVLILNE